MRNIPLLLMLLLATAAQAEVYRWVDKDGVAHYGDKAPNKDAKPAKLPPLQTMPSDTAVETPASAESGPAKAPSSSYRVSVLSPAADETVRSAERRVEVRASVDRPLAEGAGFIYYLDGSPQNSVGAAANFTLTGVERGSHLVSVALVDSSGRELGRSAPVIIHMKPPSVN